MICAMISKEHSYHKSVLSIWFWNHCIIYKLKSQFCLLVMKESITDFESSVCSSKLFPEFFKLSNGTIFVFICPNHTLGEKVALCNTVDFLNINERHSLMK